MKTIELMRHTDNDGDRLTPEGVAKAVLIGRELEGDYTVAVSSGAQRATQTIACLLAGLGQVVPDGVIVIEALRSRFENRWRAAYGKAGAGDLESLRRVDPDLVAEDSLSLSSALRRLIEMLPDGGRALVVGHSPTNEAAVYGLTGHVIGPLGKGEGIVITENGGHATVQGR